MAPTYESTRMTQPWPCALASRGRVSRPALRSWRGRPCRSHGDDDLPLGVACFEVADGLGDLAQRVGPVDDRRDLRLSQQPAEKHQVVFAVASQEWHHFLAHERRGYEHLEQARQRPDQLAFLRPAD